MTLSFKSVIDNKQIPDGAINILKMFSKSEYEAYLVGGCVRDLLLKETPHDFDICTNARPDEIKNVLESNRVKYHTIGIKFGTITAMCEDGEYEITTYRTDGEKYSDNRRPDKVEFVNELFMDLSRRDFTINAIAYSPLDNVLLDAFDGYKDLMSCELKAVGDADTRFKEDALRILRVLRFAIKYDLHIEEKTKQAMKDNKHLISNLSKERVTAELEKILTSGKEIKGWFMEYDWLIAEIIPELKQTMGFDQNNKFHQHNVYEHTLAVVDGCKTDDFIIKLAALLHDIGKPASYTEDEEGWGHFYGHPVVSKEITEQILERRLRLSREQSNTLLELIEFHDTGFASTKGAVKRYLNKHSKEFFDKWFILKESDIADHLFADNLREKYGLDNLRKMINTVIEEEACFSLKDLAINGRDIMELMQLKQGKQVGEILNTLLNEVIDEKIENNKELLSKRTLELYKQ